MTIESQPRSGQDDRGAAAELDVHDPATGEVIGFFIHSAVADEITGRLVAAVDALPVGPATDPTSRIGPLISANAVRRLTSAIDSAVPSGARIVNSPVDVPADGHYLAPHLLRDVPDDAELVTEGIFGSVAPILTWEDTPTSSSPAQTPPSSVRPAMSTRRASRRPAG